MADKLRIAGSIATGIVISVGMMLVLPMFFQALPATPSITLYVVQQGDKNAGQWCQSLHDNDTKVEHLFISGSMAEKYPNCVTLFKNAVGSMSYNYTNMTSLSYLQAKLDVAKGKQVIDKIAATNSTSFRAPFGNADSINIYSYLSAANITQDYSYSDHFNKYEQSSGFFIRKPADIHIVFSTYEHDAQ